MGTIAEKLSYLNDTKIAIKNAIVDKGVAVADSDTFRSYANKIGDIKDVLQARVDETKDCSYLFTYYSGTNPNIAKNLNTSGVTLMKNTFNQCSNLTSLDVSNFDTSRVKDMYYMFNSCSALKNLDLSNFNTSNVINMMYMFSNCGSLTSLDLSNFDTSRVTNISYMFQNCSKLTTILGIIDMIKVTSVNYTFSRCDALTDVTLKNIKKSLQMGSGTLFGTKLSNATLINTIKELWDLTGSTSQTLTLSTESKTAIESIYVKLVDPTEEQIAQDPNIIYKKNCEVCQSTDEGAMLITDYATLKNWTIA